MQLYRFKQIAGDQSRRPNMWGRTVVIQTRGYLQKRGRGKNSFLFSLVIFFFFGFDLRSLRRRGEKFVCASCKLYIFFNVVFRLPLAQSLSDRTQTPS